MTDGFDPYHQWLGISPANQPPDHYRLLGVERFESDLNVIQNAADRQMAHLRGYAKGKYGKQANHLLNQVSSANVCLLDSTKRVAYDDQLRQNVSSGEFEPAPRIDEDGALFGEYMLLDHLAVSDEGQIFKARHRTLDRQVAVRILSQTSMQSEEHLARFRLKLSLLGKFRHDNLVTAYDAGERDGTYFLIMEYVGGSDLLSMVKKQHPLPVKEVVQYFIQATYGLAYAHSKQVYHRNLNPSNILFDREGVVKIVGWSKARFAGERELDEAEAAFAGADAKRLRGAFDFLAPEQFVDNSKADVRSDIYALGCTLYYALTGTRPYEVKGAKQKAHAHAVDPIPSLCAKREDVSPALNSVFQRTLSKDPEYRYQSMDRLRVALQDAIDPQPASQSAILQSGTPVQQVASPNSSGGSPHSAQLPLRLPTPAAMTPAVIPKAAVDEVEEIVVVDEPELVEETDEIVEAEAIEPQVVDPNPNNPTQIPIATLADTPIAPPPQPPSANSPNKTSDD